MDFKHWIDRDGTSQQLILVTDESIYAETLNATDTARYLRELRGGASPANLFGKSATVVAWRAVKRTEIDEHDTDITFTTTDGGKDGTTTLNLAQRELRDDVYSAVRERLPSTLREFIDKKSRPRAAYGSLVALTVFSLGTVIAANAAAAIRAAENLEITGRRSGIKKLVVGMLDTLGPTGVSVIGGILCLLAAWVLWTRLSQPPQIRFLQAANWQPPSNFITGAKYLLLLVVWGVATRAMLA